MQSFPENLEYCWSIFTSLLSFKWFKTACGVAFGSIAYLFGETQELAWLLLILIGMDFVLALIAAHRTGKEIQSSKAVKSAIKLTVYWILVSAGHLTEVAVKVIPFIDDAIIAFLAVTELISIMEHIGDIGYVVPKRLLNKLEKFRDEQ